MSGMSSDGASGTLLREIFIFYKIFQKEGFVSNNFFWFFIAVLIVVVVGQGISTRYLANLSKKVAQAIAETEAPDVSVVATGDDEK
ncbi:MAG: hypothetical protein KGJ58_03515 [Patescibacteria group bacterium]|nr:hypothetical protein [Patescibacteria group bacterium]MDE1988212.1 hypothetical protein [Patescibacteria group bacterium]MDE2218491.1 hypothetical protein [Patescibacteria group bacterium]